MTTKYILGQMGENGKPRTIVVEEGVTHETREVEEIIEEFVRYAHEPDCIDKLRITINHQLQKAREEERERITKIVTDLKQQWGGAIDLRSAEFAESETKRRIIKNIV